MAYSSRIIILYSTIGVIESCSYTGVLVSSFVEGVLSKKEDGSIVLKDAALWSLTGFYFDAFFFFFFVEGRFMFIDSSLSVLVIRLFWLSVLVCYLSFFMSFKIVLDANDLFRIKLDLFGFIGIFIGTVDGFWQGSGFEIVITLNNSSMLLWESRCIFGDQVYVSSKFKLFIKK